MTDYSLLRKKEIAILAGGWSAERDISLMSGLAVSEALEELGINFTFLDLKSKEQAQDITSEIDIAFIALHGRGGEDGYIQEILEEKDILYTGSKPESCKIAMDKSETKKIWRDLLLPTPDFVEIQKAGTPEMKLTPYLSSEDDITALDKTFVVKPSREGSSFGITIVKPGEGSLEEAMKQAHQAVQAMGGAGFMADSPVSRIFRDAKLMEIGAGTSEIRRMLIGRELVESIN